MLRVLRILFLVIIFFITFPKTALAVLITVDSYPTEINSTSSYQISASISGAMNATNYLRVDLYKEGTTNYFGETYNGSDWYSGSDGKSYYPVTIQDSSASAKFNFQLGVPTSTQYPGPGMYKLKIRRYTSSGSPSSNDTQSAVDVQINYVFSTPTPESTPTPIPSTPTSTPIATKSPTPVATPSKTPTPKPLKTPTLETPAATESAEILGLMDTIVTPSPSPSVNENTKNQNKFPFMAAALIVAGVLLVSVSIGYTIRSAKKNSQIS